MNCLHACGPHDDDVLGDTEDGRDGIHSKDNVGELNHHEHKEQRSALA